MKIAMIRGMIIAALTITPWLEGRLQAAADPARGDLPPALALVPAESMVFLHIRVQQAWDGDMMKELRKEFPKLAEDLQKFPDLPGRFSIMDVESLTIAAPKLPDLQKTSVEDAFVAMVTMRQPLDREKLLKEVLKSPVERKAQEKIYFISEKDALGPAFHFAGDHTLMAGREGVLKQVLSSRPADPKSDLGKALRRAADGPDITLGLFLPDNYFQKSLEELQREPIAEAIIQDLLPLLKARSLVLTLDAGKEGGANLHLVYPSEEAARRAALAAEDALVFFRVLAVGGIAAGMRQEASMVKDEKKRDAALIGVVVLTRLQTALRSAKPKQEGTSLQVMVRTRLDSLGADIEKERKANEKTRR